MDLIKEMYECGKFDICIPLHNGEWINSLDLVCRVEDCFQCKYGLEYGELKVDRECLFARIDEKCIEEYLVENEPRAVLKIVKGMQLPEDNVKYWQKEIQKIYSIEEYPELWL